MSTVPRTIRVPLSSLADQWQFPLLFAALILFAWGVARLTPRVPPPTFEEEISAIHRLIALGDCITAHKALVTLVDDHLGDNHRASTLYSLLAEAVHAGERALQRHDPANAERIVAYLNAAARHGATTTASDAERRADALSWLGRHAEAIESYQAALAAAEALDNAAATRRRFIACLERLPEPDASAVAAQHDAILTDERADTSDRLWALRRQIKRLLREGGAGDGLALIDRVEDRFAATPEAHELSWWRAACEIELGRLDEANRRLRDLRERGGVKDELWGRAGALLARAELLAGRAEAALSLHDEVLDVFRSGLCHFECLQGRAEALIALERHDEAAVAFGELVAAADDPRTCDWIEADVLRARIRTLAEQLNADGRPELGVLFLRLIRPLISSEPVEQAAAYETALATLLDSLAEKLDPAEQSVERRALHIEAAESWLRASALKALEEAAAVDAYWRAIDGFEAAGDAGRAIPLLEKFIIERPVEISRPAALRRLGGLRQSLRAYASAIEAYEQLLREYPRTQDALRCMTPLASCLLEQDEASAQRGERLLRSIVDDDAAREPLFDPRAPEYADALYALTSLLYDQGRHEEAIFRGESFLALHPADPRGPDVKFLLGDDYRRSSQALAADAAQTADPELKARTVDESRRRMAQAAEWFAAFLTAAELPSASQTAPRLAQRRAALMYRADCLFDLGRLAEARDAYAEAAWQCEGDPTSLAAQMQMVQCLRRLGQPDESRAALARLRQMVRQLPDSAFAAQAGGATKAYWQETVERLSRMEVY